MDENMNRNTLLTPPTGAARKLSSGSKHSNIDDVAGDIVRDKAYVKPFENVLNEGPSKPKNGDTDHAVVDIRVKTEASNRLIFRHNAILRRKRSCILSLVFAAIGLTLMVILNEWTFNQTFTDEMTDLAVLSGYPLVVARTIRCLIVLSTLALLLCIIVYHVSDLQLYMFQQGIDDWQIAITPGLLLKILIELIVCSICPIPGNFYFWWWTEHYDGATRTNPKVPVDILLSIPMFFRFYLVPRVLLLCLPLFDSTATRVIASMNRVRFSIGFVLKTLSTLYPGLSLLVFAITYIASASYVVRLCERYHYLDSNMTVIVEAKRFTNYFNTVWYIGITFLTIGYGDIVVNTYCGRAVGFLTGMIGVALTALIINVVSAKMHLSSGEARVFDFIGSNSLETDLRHAAANVIRETWYIHKYRKHRKSSSNELQREIDKGYLRHLQRRFMKALKRFRKMEIRQLAASDGDSPDLAEMCEQNRKAIDTLSLESSRNFTTVQASLQECNAQLLAVRNALNLIANQKLES